MRANRLKIGLFKEMDSVWPKISGTRSHPPPTIFPVSKLDEWALYGIRILAEVSFILSQLTCFDTQIDISLIAKIALHICRLLRGKHPQHPHVIRNWVFHFVLQASQTDKKNSSTAGGG